MSESIEDLMRCPILVIISLETSFYRRKLKKALVVKSVCFKKKYRIMKKEKKRGL